MLSIGMTKTRCQWLPPFPAMMKQIEIAFYQGQMKDVIGQEHGEMAQNQSVDGRGSWFAGNDRFVWVGWNLAALPAIELRGYSGRCISSRGGCSRRRTEL